MQTMHFRIRMLWSLMSLAHVAVRRSLPKVTGCMLYLTFCLRTCVYFCLPPTRAGMALLFNDGLEWGTIRSFLFFWWLFLDSLWAVHHILASGSWTGGEEEGLKYFYFVFYYVLKLKVEPHQFWKLFPISPQYMGWAGGGVFPPFRQWAPASSAELGSRSSLGKSLDGNEHEVGTALLGQHSSASQDVSWISHFFFTSVDEKMCFFEAVTYLVFLEDLS